MMGKWHLGVTAENSPKVAGFDRSYSLLNGAGSHWDEVGFYEGGSILWSDENFSHWPEGAYSTDYFTDRLIGFMEQGKDDNKPFFAFAAYTSPHWPLTTPEKYLNRYAGRYDQGYEHLRKQRFDSLKAAGIIPADSKLPPRNEDIAPWDSLDKEAQKRESRKMELYAAMVENLDDNVGRLIEYLKENDLYENTLIVFISDNGAAGEDFYNTGKFVEFIRARYDNSYEKMGLPGSFVSYGPQWAEAGSAPFSLYKGFTREGGITAPMIMRGPGVARSGEINTSYLTVMDIAPTFLEIAGAKYPVKEGIWPLAGESAVALMAGEAQSVHDEQYVTTLSHRGRVLIRQGRWKLVNINGPFDESDLELFDLQADPGETVNLADSQPEKFEQMLELWRSERRRLGIVVPKDL
jgi:arylsulfatase